MTEPKKPNSRRLTTAEALIVAGGLTFIAPSVVEPIVGSLGWAYSGIAIAGIFLCVCGGLLVYGQNDAFVAHLSKGKDQQLALWRSRPIRQSAPILLILIFGAIILFQSEWDLEADQVAAIGIAVLVLSEVADRCLDAIRSEP